MSVRFAVPSSPVISSLDRRDAVTGSLCAAPVGGLMWRLLFTHHQHLGTGPLLKTAPLSPWHYQGRSPRSAPPLVKGEESASFGFLFSSKGSPARAISDARRGDFFVLPPLGETIAVFSVPAEGVQTIYSARAILRRDNASRTKEKPRRATVEPPSGPGECSRIVPERSRIVPERSRIVPERSRIVLSALLLSGSSHDYGDRYSDSRERGERGERGEGKSFFS